MLSILLPLLKLLAENLYERNQMRSSIHRSHLSNGLLLQKYHYTCMPMHNSPVRLVFLQDAPSAENSITANLFIEGIQKYCSCTLWPTVQMTKLCAFGVLYYLLYNMPSSVLYHS
jgi:hypothetical protein